MVDTLSRLSDLIGNLLDAPLLEEMFVNDVVFLLCQNVFQILQQQPVLIF